MTARKIRNPEIRAALNGPVQRKPWRPSSPQECQRWLRVVMGAVGLPTDSAVLKTLAGNLAVITANPNPLHALLVNDRLKLAHEQLTAPGRPGVKPELLPRMVAFMLIFAYRDLTGSDIKPGNRKKLQSVAKAVFVRCAFKADAKDVIEKALKQATHIP